MESIEFTAFLLEKLLNEVFHSKNQMAKQLGVSPRTLRYTMNKGRNAKGASIVSLNAYYYCLEHCVDLQTLFSEFMESKKGGHIWQDKRLWTILVECRARSFLDLEALRPLFYSSRVWILFV